jgi:hypothetical protein
MKMTAALKQQETAKLGPAQRLVLGGLAWNDYVRIGDILRDRPALRLMANREVGAVIFEDK